MRLLLRLVFLGIPCTVQSFAPKWLLPLQQPLSKVSATGGRLAGKAPPEGATVWDDVGTLRRDLAQVLALRTEDPTLLVHKSLVSEGLTVTQFMTFEAWDFLMNDPNRYWSSMWTLVRGKSTIFNRIAPVCGAFAGFAGLLWLYNNVLIRRLSTSLSLQLPALHALPLAPISLQGSALALLLVFRTNSSYARFVEARGLWGTAVFRARDLGQQLSVWMAPKYYDPVLQSDVKGIALMAVCRYLVAYGWCLKAHLRSGEHSDDVVEALFRGPEKKWILEQPNRPLALLHRVRQVIHSEEVGLNIAQLDAAEQAVTGLAQVVGGTERLMSTGIPPTYTRHTTRALVMWLAALPLALAPTMGLSWLTLSMLSTTFTFLGILEIGVQIEQPMTILPLQGLAKAIQRDVTLAIVPDDPAPPPRIGYWQ